MSSAVNRPTDQRQKEKDINQKLQLYGIYAAFANGKVPSNKQIDIALSSTLELDPLAHPSKKLSDDGQKLVADFRDVVEKAKILLLTKNDGNLFQDFVWQTQQLSTGDIKAPIAPVDKSTVKHHGNETLNGLRTLGTLLLSNGQFRKLLSDMTVLLRDIAGDAAVNAAGRVRPSQEKLSQIDHPAESNTWHEVPKIENLKKQAKEKLEKQKSYIKKDVPKSQEEGHTSEVKSQKGIHAGAKNIKSQFTANIPQETKDRVNAYGGKAKNYFGTKVPKERRDQTIWRLKKMILEIQGREEYMNAVETLLNLAENYKGHSRTVVKQGTGTVKGVHEKSSLRTAETDLKILIERFANSTSMDDFLESLDEIYRDAEKDPDLKAWFLRISSFIRRCLKETGFIVQDDVNREWSELHAQGRHFVRERYSTHFDRVIDEIKFFCGQFEHDPQNKAFGDSLQKLCLDLGKDVNGKPAFKPHLVKDLSQVILPGIFENIRYMPIPRIEFSDNQVDVVVENLVIEGDNLAPNVVEFGSDNYWLWGRKNISSKHKNKVMLSVSGIQLDLRDVSYYVKKKHGFPSIVDKGVCDIFLGGQGFGFKVDMETADETDTNHFFKIQRVVAKVCNFNIKMKKSSHKLLFSLFKPLLIKAMNPVITKILEKQVKESVQKADSLLFSVHQEAKKAEADAKKTDAEKAQNIYHHYLAAIKKQITLGKEKKKKAKEAKESSQTKVNVAVTQHDSILKDIVLPGGISAKATEFKDLAAKGEKWESPVFSIGSAKETAEYPKPGVVERKPHGKVKSITTGNGTTGFGTQVDEAFGNE